MRVTDPDDADVLDAIYAPARRMLSGFLDPRLLPHRAEMVRALRPRDEDYARVFTAEIAPRGRRGYEAWLWATNPIWPIEPHQTILNLAAAFSDDFQTHSSLCRHFPGGYRRVAGFLLPRVLWVSCEFLSPGERFGTTIDGLVPIDGRWTWFPKPWRVIPRTRRLLWHD